MLPPVLAARISHPDHVGPLVVPAATAFHKIHSLVLVAGGGTPLLWQHRSILGPVLDHFCLHRVLGTKGAWTQYQSFRRGGSINSWCAQTGGAAGKERGRDRGRGNLKCWAPAANSSCFCFRVINVLLNRARAWAPVSAAFNAISSPGCTGLGAAGGGLYFLPSPVNEVM